MMYRSVWIMARVALTIAASTLASGCTGAATQPGSPPPLATVAASPLAPAQVSQWLSFDAAAKTATLTMVADAQGVDNRYNFNGYSHGSLVITVPRGWMVTVHCNDDPLAAYAHSCAVVSGAESKTSAFSGRASPIRPEADTLVQAKAKALRSRQAHRLSAASPAF